MNVSSLNRTSLGVKELFYNGTGFYIDDETEPGLNDVETVIFACFATLLPLAVSLLAICGMRVLWVKYKKRKEEAKYDGVLQKVDTSDSVSMPLHTHLFNSDKKSDTQLAINTEEVEICDSLPPSRPSNHSSTNGSIITMTLKNNHLIVETEERNDLDLEEDSRETTMKYSPSARDGVFVVEVQQGARRSPSTTSRDQCALVHHAPETSSTNGEPPRTGLAQSDTSLSHSSYCYSDQQCHDHGKYGYVAYSGCHVDEQPTFHKYKLEQPVNHKPVIKGALYKEFLPVEEPTNPAPVD